MPRKASTIAPAVRIRENQRRARARRKELIDDLKSRIRDCEAQGVVATAQVQEAARKVLLENRQLRALLAQKGVSTGEIETFLQGYEHDASIAVTSVMPEAADSVNGQGPAALLVEAQRPVEIRPDTSDQPKQLALAALSPAVTMDVRFESGSQTSQDGRSLESFSEAELQRSREQAEKDLGRGSALLTLLEPVSDCYCPETEPVASDAGTSRTECSIAANILASFRGHGDAEKARDELGCPDTTPCSIPNAALLDAMDSGV